MPSPISTKRMNTPSASTTTESGSYSSGRPISASMKAGTPRAATGSLPWGPAPPACFSPTTDLHSFAVAGAGFSQKKNARESESDPTSSLPTAGTALRYAGVTSLLEGAGEDDGHVVIRVDEVNLITRPHRGYYVAVAAVELQLTAASVKDNRARELAVDKDVKGICR